VIQQYHSQGLPEGMPPKLLQRHLHTHVFVALFTIAKLWKQPRFLTTDKQIKKRWYLYTIEFYSATEKNEILSFISKRMGLENIILSKGSQDQKAKNSMFSLRCGL
jgi:hypothetical protein